MIEWDDMICVVILIGLGDKVFSVGVDIVGFLFSVEVGVVIVMCEFVGCG